jgi:chorismate dehydratase
VAQKLRLSFIEFLNAIPLGWGFLHGSDKGAFDLLFDVPSECARHLSSKEVDIGLIPVIEFQRISGLRVIPDISISSQRRVRSVLFVSRVPIEEISTVALDTSSKTSAVLLRILLSEFYGKESIRYSEQRPDPTIMLRSFDAALLIGHNAITSSLDGLKVYDLAQEWYRFTGFPFVFAFWAVREGVDLAEQGEIFYRSRGEGLKAIDKIAEMYSSQLSIAPAKIRSYLKNNLDYSLDDKNLAGLNYFYELATKIGDIPRTDPLRFL